MQSGQHLYLLPELTDYSDVVVLDTEVPLRAGRTHHSWKEAGSHPEAAEQTPQGKPKKLQYLR